MHSTQLRVGTTAEWADTDPTDNTAAPILELGELGLDTTLGQLRVGDGTTAFPSLPTSFRKSRIVTAAALVAGVKVVTDPLITANSIVIPILKTIGGVSLPVAVAVTARTPGTSFTLTSGSASDTSVYTCLIIEP